MVNGAMKKFLATAVAVLFILFLSIAVTFSLLKYCAHKDSVEDSMQRELIREILIDSESVVKIVKFGRSRENSYKYYLSLVLNDGTKLVLNDVYVLKGTLYGDIFRFDDFTMPRLLVYNGKSVLAENYLFTNISDSDVIAIYHHHNLSRLLVQKEKMRNFLTGFPFLDETDQKKLGGNKEMYSQLVQEFGLTREVKKWVVLDANAFFCSSKPTN